ncbi:hypothetical protein ACIPY3_02495 [Paenarthrobacter sp. NPDC089714]|uniref:hypothetical protein n=1 Tax=Paenarthrobacter sp. NPDC089714 TaxID=3364377 RepID=UPI00381D694F
MMRTTTTSAGTTVTVEDRDGDRAVVLDHPDAPDFARNAEAGRFLNGGFQPAPFVAFALGPDALRAIADLLELEG